MNERVPHVTYLARAFASRRLERLRAAAVSPGPFQAWILHRLLRAASKTPFGFQRGLCPEIGLDGYRDAMPVDTSAAFVPRPLSATDAAAGTPGDPRIAAYAVPWAGLLGVADSPGSLDLVPVVDGEVFLEFVPAAQVALARPPRVPLVAVQAGQVYGITVTTDGDVWSRLTGDLVRFTSVRPYRFRVVGAVTASRDDSRALCAASPPA